MYILPLSETEEKLRVCGFVNVTNLPFYNLFEDAERIIIAHPNHYGCWGYDGKCFVVVTVQGRVWMRYGKPADQLINEAAPCGEGARMPLAGEEKFSNYLHLFQRFADPLACVDEEYSSNPCLEEEPSL